MATENKVVKVEGSLFGSYYWPSWLKWCPTSLQSLEEAETNLLSYVKNKMELFFVPIKNSTLYIRSMTAFKLSETEKKEKQNTLPIVMMHGMGSGIGLWCKNIDAISDNRKFYAMDVLGFGFSSRPEFSNDPKIVEEMFNESFEDWRQHLGIEKFILLGHSMGGYLAYSYAIKHPEKVRHLILADPWGFSKFNPEHLSSLKRNIFIRGVAAIMKSLNPLAPIRFAGPFGPGLIRKFRPDLGHYFQLDNTEEELLVEPTQNQDVYDYIYHCNAQYPSGEIAFKTLSHNFGWALNPMVDRALDLDSSVPITFLYGQESWMDMSAGIEFQKERNGSFVDVQQQLLRLERYITKHRLLLTMETLMLFFIRQLMDKMQSLHMQNYTIIMDNCSLHKVAGIRELIEKTAINSYFFHHTVPILMLLKNSLQNGKAT